MSELFFCWSGDRSHRLAQALKAHLPQFIPELADSGSHRLFISDEIIKGTRWFDEVEEQLERADVGLVCITREGLQSGWIHFEAGALARSIRRRRASGAMLFTYLLGVRVDELTGPLAEFQATTFDCDDTKRLCAAIVSVMPSLPAGAAADWERAFTANWAAFEAEVKRIGPQPVTDLIPGLEELFRRKTFNEPIEECTRQSWIDRFTAARETLAALESHRPVMTADDTYLLDLYNQLGAELDGYSMNMGALLLKERRFAIDPKSGRLDVGPGIVQACERRRGRIRQLVTHLLTPNCAPVLEESRRYAKMSSFEERKTLLIHPAEHEIRRSPAQPVKSLWTTELTADVLEKCAASLWEFDRICCYLAREHDPASDADDLVAAVEREFETVRAVDGGGSLVPLHYALRALKTRLAAAPVTAGFVDTDTLGRLLERIEQIIVELHLDPGKQVRDNLDVLKRIIGLSSGSAMLAG